MSDTISTIPGSPGILAEDTLAEAARKTWNFHFVTMLYHEPATRLGEDIEALHDMRVATRRMRAAFEVFGTAFRAKKLRPYLTGLRNTGRALGHARDMDVVVENANMYLESVARRKRAALAPLIDAWQAERAAARQEMLRYLDSDPYKEFTHEFRNFLDRPTLPGTKSAGETSVAQSIPEIIDSRLEAVQDYQEILPSASIVQLHALRIEFKKLRYAVEFLREPLGQSAKGVIDLLKKMQDHLGELHDSDVACQNLREFLAGWDETQIAFPLLERHSPEAVVAYLNSQYTIRHHLMLTFPAAWQDFQQSDALKQLAIYAGIEPEPGPETGQPAEGGETSEQ